MRSIVLGVYSISLGDTALKMSLSEMQTFRATAREVEPEAMVNALHLYNMMD